MMVDINNGDSNTDKNDKRSIVSKNSKYDFMHVAVDKL